MSDYLNNVEVTNFNLQSHREVAQIWTQENITLGIMNWGYTNVYPQSLTNLIEQSPIAKTAVSRTSKFYQGAGFVGENEIISNRGLTLKDVVTMMADDYARWEAFAVHVNYNMNGKVTSINPMRISDFRFNKFDELNYSSKVGYHYNFGGNSDIKKAITKTVTKDQIKWFDRFNPKVVAKQIALTEKGISNYLGQVLYHSSSGHSSYPVSPLQAPINYVLSDVENSILVRKETSTGFISTYIMKTTLDADDANVIAMESALEASQGARGYGKIITFAGMDPEAFANTILEEVGAGSAGAKTVIEASALTYELDHKVITGTYQIPPALGGADNKTGFSGADLEEAYYVFNAITAGGRSVIENHLNRILANSVFDIAPIKIKKLTLDVEEEEVTSDDNGEVTPEAEAIANKVFADMTGKQMQSLQRVVRKFNKGEITKPQASQMLEGFGLTTEQVNVWLEE